MTEFERVLKRVAAPRLKALGYEFDDNLKDSDVLLGFRRHLGDDVQAIVRFQRHARGGRALSDDFSVDLIRAQSEVIHPHVYGGYAGALGAQLSQVLWYVADMQAYGQPDHWWTPRSGRALARNIAEVVDYLEQVGLPWLEDPEAQKPWEMPSHEGREFQMALRSIVAPRLEQLGYRPESHPLAGDHAHCYFVKRLRKDWHAIVEFQPIYSLDPSHFEFDVRLQRKRSSNPFKFGKRYRYWRRTSLGQLMRRAYAARREQQPSMPEFRPVTWRYANHCELEACLHDAVEKVAEVAVPWLENVESRSMVLQ